MLSLPVCLAEWAAGLEFEVLRPPPHSDWGEEGGEGPDGSGEEPRVSVLLSLNQFESGSCNGFNSRAAASARGREGRGRDETRRRTVGEARLRPGGKSQAGMGGGAGRSCLPQQGPLPACRFRGRLSFPASRRAECCLAESLTRVRDASSCHVIRPLCTQT